MTKDELNHKVHNIANVIYHNLQLIRQSLIEMGFILNNQPFILSFLLLGYPKNYGTNLIDIHGRNATILLNALVEGETSITKLINVFFSNIDDVDFKVNKNDMRTLLNKAREELSEVSKKYWGSLSKSRDKIAAHQDIVNTESPSKIGENVFYYGDMKTMLEQLEQIFAYVYCPLTGNKYEIYPEKSFIEEALGIMIESKTKELKSKLKSESETN